MATRSKNSEGAPAPKRPRRATKATQSATPELSAALVASEAADMGVKSDTVVGETAKSVDDSRIAQRAYELYEQRGRQEGRALEDWLNAESQLLGRAIQGQA